MDFFERAHVPRKPTSKMEKKPDSAVKKQLKQMMNAYKTGNNEDIRSSSELKHKYDFEEKISISEFSDFSITPADNSMTTESSNGSDDVQSIRDEANSSKSSTLEVFKELEDSSQDITECCDSFKTLSTSMDDSSSSSSLENSSDVLESDSNDSVQSLPISLITSTGSDTGTDISDDEFDPDGVLASRILKNLDNKESVCKKRKISKEIVEVDVSKDVNKTKEECKEVEIKRKSKKVQQGTQKSSTEYFIEEDLTSDFDSGQNLQESENIAFKDNKKGKQSKQMSQPFIVLSDDSINNSVDSTTTSFSSPFISVSVENMASQSLGELLGDYLYPITRNLPTEPTIPIKKASKIFSADNMIIKDVIDDEISSLIPEVDEELAIDDLNVDTNTQELIKESDAINDIIPTEDMTEPRPTEDMTTDSIPVDETTIEDELTMEEAVPMTLYSGKEKFVLVMKHPAELYIHGKLQIADINGMVEIFGYKLNYDSVEVYAPYCNFAHCLRTLENPHRTNPDLFDELISAGLSDTDAREIVSNIEENSAVIILSKLDNRMIDFVNKNFSTMDLFMKRSDNSPCFLKKVADKLGCSFYLKPPKRRFEEKSVWDDVYASSREGSRGIICGGKGVGKSTFLRHYVNTLLSDGPVLVIDLDPGQAEFTICGNISATIVERPLIGPNFTHLKTPEKMLNIGIMNTMDNAKRYLSAVSDLILYCRSNEDFRQLPWIVNTMGLCNHMGLKFMTSIILQTQPTFVFQIDSKIPKKRFEVELDPLTLTQLYEKYYSSDRSFRNIQDPYLLKYSFVIARHEENASPVKGSSFGSSLIPRDERYLNILAYFGELLNEHRSQGLMEIVPYEVNLTDLNIGLNIKIEADSVAKVINGKIIALCQQKAHDKGQVFTLADKALLCHGHGLIRGIDFEQGLLYILTPTHIGKLASVDTLVYSDWMPELRGLEGDLPSGTTIPYRTANTALHQRKLMFAPKRRFNPLQLLKMSRNT